MAIDLVFYLRSREIPSDMLEQSRTYVRTKTKLDAVKSILALFRTAGWNITLSEAIQLHRLLKATDAPSALGADE